MICRVGDRTFRGRAVTVGDAAPALDPETVATAVREGRAETADGSVVAVTARAAGPVHERAGCITPDCTLRPRTALAVAARSRGWSTPVDDALAAARARLASFDAPSDDLAATDGSPPGRRLAEADDDVARLRERVAEARGRVQARRDHDADSDAEAARTLEDAVRDLSEAETTAAAAREERRAARAEARAARDRLAHRLRLADEVANVEREARGYLVERARAAYESALSTVPDVTAPADPFEAPPDAMALAVARVADLGAPVVVATGRFEDSRAAARWLDAPAIHLDP